MLTTEAWSLYRMIRLVRKSYLPTHTSLSRQQVKLLEAEAARRAKWDAKFAGDVYRGAPPPPRNLCKEIHLCSEN